MNRLIILCLITLIAGGCCDKIKFNTKVSPMSEIQKMNNIVEISFWHCGGFNEAGECTPMRKWSGISDRQKISEIMSVVKELKITSGTGGDTPGILICFKDKSGNFMCTNKECESGKILYGPDYRDETGKLYDTLKSSGLWDIETVAEGKKLKIVSMAEIRKIDDVKEISMWYYHQIMSSTEIEGLEKEAVTTNKQRIADIMSVIKNFKKKPDIETVPLSLICFEDPNGKLFCTYFGTDPQKETYGLDYVDKTGMLYDTLQAAGLMWKKADAESKDANTAVLH